MKMADQSIAIIFDSVHYVKYKIISVSVSWFALVLGWWLEFSCFFLNLYISSSPQH